jgi:hypothetical protein
MTETMLKKKSICLMLKNVNTQGEIQAVTPSTAATQTPGKCCVKKCV